MKGQHTYYQEEPDPLVDSELTDITADELIAKLKLSRQLVLIAQCDKKIFEEDGINQAIGDEKKRSEYEERKRQASLSIRYATHNLNHVQKWLENIWLRYGRSRTEALPFRCVAMSQIKTALQRRINTKRRRMNAVSHATISFNDQRKHGDQRKKQMEHTLEEKKSLSINIFRSNDISTSDFYLRTLIRQTRDVTMLVANQMTYFDALHDAVSKFTRIKDYLGDDHMWFERNLTDLQLSIVEQERQLRYLAGVFNESAEGAFRAEKAYNETDFDLKKAQIAEKEMLNDLHQALEQHRSLCTVRLKELVNMNVEIKGCFDQRSSVRKFPFHHSAELPLVKKAVNNTELVRTFELLQDLTQSRTPAEVLQNVRQQVDQYLVLESSNRRLNHLLSTILQPEEKMFAEEYDSSCMSTVTRREALEKALMKVHDAFDKKVTMARAVISEQRDNADEFEFFIETLDGVNERICRTFTQASDLYDECHQPGLEGLLALTMKNLMVVSVSGLSSCLDQTWDQLKHYVNHRDFLEYRSGKLALANDRTKHGQPIQQEEMVEEHRLASLPLVVSSAYLTNKQIKEANWQLMERSRRAELERIRAGNEKEEEERLIIQKRKLRKEATAQAAAKKKRKGPKRKDNFRKTLLAKVVLQKMAKSNK